MYQHHTIAAGFVLVNHGKTDDALSAAREQLGEDAWTSGYTERSSITTRSHLKKADVPVVTKIAGALKSISCKETKDSKGNVYQKIRVELQEDGKEQSTILTMEPREEFAQRLLAKLENVGVGEIITVGAFAEVIERNGRTFANHIATVKDRDGAEIKPSKDHFRQANDAVQAALGALRAAGIRDNQVINKARQASKAEYFWALAKSLETTQQTATA